MNYSVKEIEKIVRDKFQGKKRLNHILGVKKMASFIGSYLGLDVEKLEIIALLHDYAKHETLERQIELINDPEYLEKYKDSTPIYHAYAGANLVREELGITDPVILDSIKYHVFGRVGMNIYEKVIVLSDYIEETREYESCIRVRKIMTEELNFPKALYYCIKEMIDNLEHIGIVPKEEQYEILEEVRSYYMEMELLKLIKEALEKVKATDIQIYDLRGVSPLADFTVIATVDVIRQASGVISYIEEKAHETNIKIRGIEGRDSTWILLDFYDVILHVFTRDERMNYDLDKLYLNINKIDINEIK